MNPNELVSSWIDILDVLFWTAGEQNVQAGFRDELAFAGLVLTMNAVIAAKSDDNVTTIISCSSRHSNCLISSNRYPLEQ